MAAESQNVVFDASVAVKWFVPEQDSKDALTLRDQHIEGRLTLYAPALIIYEVANALRYRSDITETDLEHDIEALFQLDIAFIAPSSKSTAKAALTAKRLGITVYDAVYVELAEDIGCKLVTADDDLNRKAKDTHLVTLLSDHLLD